MNSRMRTVLQQPQIHTTHEAAENLQTELRGTRTPETQVWIARMGMVEQSTGETQPKPLQLHKYVTNGMCTIRKPRPRLGALKA